MSRMPIRMAKAMPYPRLELTDVANASEMPMMYAPSTAPGMLPMPPRTAAMNAFKPGHMPRNGDASMPEVVPYRMPPAPASAGPTMKAVLMTTSMLMPMRLAVGLSNATARICLPMRVLLTNQNSRIIRKTETPTSSSNTLEMERPRFLGWE